MTGKEYEMQELVPPDNVASISLDYCNQNTTSVQDNHSKSFVFDYSRTALENGFVDVDGKIISSWKVIDEIKEDKELLAHPYILNFINQKLLKAALIYVLHVVGAILLFSLLAWHIVRPSIIKDVCISILLIFFSVGLTTKITLKVRMTSYNAWFIVGSAFNIASYSATGAYVLAPYRFKLDDYDKEWKELVMWFLPIFAIIAAYLNLLYVLRKSPCGIYVQMLAKIFKSFLKISVIWIPTLITFSFAFLLVMRDTNVKPWAPIHSTNKTISDMALDLVQAISKTSTMMVGEMDVNDILEAKKFVPSVLVVVFEVMTVILLMNMITSLAVGEVSDLRRDALEMTLRIKANFVIEGLQLSEQMTNDLKWAGIKFTLHTESAANCLMVRDKKYVAWRGDGAEDTQVEDKIWARFKKFFIGLDMAEYLKDWEPAATN